MSTQGLINAPQQGVVVQRPKFDIYSMLLLISFLAILIGCLCLALELNRYDWNFKATTAMLQNGGSSLAQAMRMLA